MSAHRIATRRPTDRRVTARLELARATSAAIDVGLACHVHFPGTARTVSAIVPSTRVLAFDVPRGAEAVCVTLAERFSGGWLRHSRCRFDGTRVEDEAALKDEQLRVGSPPYGSARLRLSEPIAVVSETLVREWFHVPRECEAVLRAANARWFDALEPADSTIARVHAATWNNHPDSIPGWCFAFPPAAERGYSDDDLKGVFTRAFETLRPRRFEIVDLLQAPEREVAAVVALGLGMFGQSITYERDVTVRGVAVERFSSTARLDGVGDCEDMAKESALAFGDLVAHEASVDLALYRLSETARLFQFCTCLATVRRHPGGGLEAHAFGMMIPNGAFPAELLTSDERARYVTRDRATYACDGVYDCHPTKVKISKHAGREPRAGEQAAPWEYAHVVSAFVFNRGEVYFRSSSRRGTYGVPFSKLFPTMDADVECVDALGVDSEALRRAATLVLRSNLPRATRTFGFETLTPVARFDQVVADTKDRAAHILKTFDAMSATSRRRFERLGDQLRAPCVDAAAFDELRVATTAYAETAFQVDRDGRTTAKTQGGYGQVVEPSPAPHSDDAPVVGGHTHHRLEGRETFRERSPPTPEDYVSFAARRVWALLNARGSSPSALHEAAIVVTNGAVYELNETGRADGIVTRAFIALATSDAVPTEADVWRKVRDAARKMLEPNAYVAYSEKERCFGLKRGVDVFKKGPAHDAYLKLFADKIGVRTICQETSVYRQKCGI